MVDRERINKNRNVRMGCGNLGTICLLLLLTLVCQQICALDCDVSVGYQYNIIQVDDLYTHAPLYIRLDIDQALGPISLYGSYTNEMEKGSSHYFTPKLDEFLIGVALQIGPFVVRYEHQCFHPVVCWRRTIPHLNGGYDKVELTYSSKTKTP